MYAVRNAMHIRTGQRAAAEAVDAWLGQHQVDVAAFADVYAACAFLLKHFDRVPELTFIGADWLAESEFAIARYIRETWPRTGIVLYGSAGVPLGADVAPLVLTCRGEAALREVIALRPAEVLRKIHSTAAPLSVGPRPEASRTLLASAEVKEVHCMGAADTKSASSAPRGDHDACVPNSKSPHNLHVAETETTRPILTAEELSSLLETPDEQ